MTDELRTSIHQLSEKEAKSLLFQTIFRLKMIQESNESSKQMIDALYSWNKDTLKFFQNKHKRAEKKYTAVHIVCGESPAGSLRVGLERDQKVIGFPDCFAVGSIGSLHKEAGRKERYEWLKDHLNYGDDFLEGKHENKIEKTLEGIIGIPDHVPIVLWTAENADEQTGVRYLSYLLKDKPNDVFLINTTISFQELYNTKEFQYVYPHTGEVHPEKLNAIYLRKQSEPLRNEERKRLESEWVTLADSTEKLRIWENNEIKAVNEDYFDELIIATARKLHAEQLEKDFMKSGRLIGEVYGKIESKVSDAYLEYRVRSLLYRGVFEIKGIPKAMRYYSVKLRE